MPGGFIVGLAMWVPSMGYFYFRPNLWILDWVVLPLAWLLTVVGIFLVVVGLVRARAAILAVVVLPIVLVVTLLLTSWWMVSPRGWFAVHRPLFDLALSVDPGASYYGADLPVHLRFLSATGKVSARPSGARFFPQWMGSPTTRVGTGTARRPPPRAMTCTG